MKSYEKDPLAAIQTAEAWARGEATVEQAKAAAITATRVAGYAGRAASADYTAALAAGCAASTVESDFIALHIVYAGATSDPDDAAAGAALCVYASTVHAAAEAADSFGIYAASYAKASASVSQTLSNSHGSRDALVAAVTARAVARTCLDNARDAAEIAFAAAEAAYAVAGDATPPTLVKCAHIVRAHISWESVEAAVRRFEG